MFEDVEPVKRHTLEAQTYGLTQSISNATLQSLKIEKSEDVYADQMIYRLSMEMLSEKLADDTYKARYQYNVFSSWWQHFKHDHMPKWFVRKFPIQYTRKGGYVTVKFTRYANYPNANIALRENQRTYEYLLGGNEVIKDYVSQVS